MNTTKYVYGINYHSKFPRLFIYEPVGGPKSYSASTPRIYIGGKLYVKKCEVSMPEDVNQHLWVKITAAYFEGKELLEKASTVKELEEFYRQYFSTTGELKKIKRQMSSNCGCNAKWIQVHRELQDLYGQKLSDLTQASRCSFRVHAHYCTYCGGTKIV